MSSIKYLYCIGVFIKEISLQAIYHVGLRCRREWPKWTKCLDCNHELFNKVVSVTLKRAIDSYHLLLIALPEHLNSSPIFSSFLVAKYLLF
jgi:hypothetical protein